LGWGIGLEGVAFSLLPLVAGTGAKTLMTRAHANRGKIGKEKVLS